jgi:hypothetical protein
MDGMDPQALIADLLPVLRASVVGRYAVALAGAHAKGHWDSGSDLDLYLLADELKPVTERRALLEALGAQQLYLSPGLDPHAWGGSMDFHYRGVPVETTVRSIGRMQAVVKECAAGRFTVLPELWTIHGYYDHIYLSEASFLKPLDDSWKLIPTLREQVEPYPPAFRQAAIAYFWPRANYWMHSFHYLSAIQRGDYAYTSGILQQSVHHLAQTLFPLNQRFFMGDKRLPQQLAALPFCPAALRERLHFLLSAPVEPRVLAEQRELFLQALAEVAQVLAEEGLLAEPGD